MRLVLAAAAACQASAGPTDGGQVNVYDKNQQSSYNIGEHDIYENENLRWTQKAFIAPQMHPWESLLYDPDQHEWTWQKWYQDTVDRYSGVDMVLMWATYPQLGIDERNSFDMYRTLPGGLQGLKSMIESWKAGVADRDFRVIVGWNSWDTSLRLESPETAGGKGGSGMDWGPNLARLNTNISGDGFNADIYNCPMDNGMETLDGQGGGGPRWAVQPEKVHLQDCSGQLNKFTLGWDEWLGPNPGEFEDGAAVPLDAYRLTVDPRFKTQFQDRWKKPSLVGDEIQEGVGLIHAAFQSASGWASWENVWGYWNGYTDFDCQLAKAAFTTIRHFWDDWLAAPDSWTGMSSGLTSDGPVFGSEFHSKSGVMWLIINRSPEPQNFTAPVGEDCITGVSTKQMLGTSFLQDGVQVGSGTIEGYGIACRRASKKLRDFLERQSLEGSRLLAEAYSEEPAGEEDRKHFQVMRQITSRPLNSYSKAAVVLQQEEVTDSTIGPACPTGMKKVEAVENWRFITQSTQKEVCLSAWTYGAPYGDVQFDQEEQISCQHDFAVSLQEFFMDEHLATNAQYLEYLNATGYVPWDYHFGKQPGDWHVLGHGDRWLNDWDHTGSAHDGSRWTIFPKINPGDENRPVRYVGYNEGKGFCNSQGKRLPSTYEWQYAAQGNEGRECPWGGSAPCDKFAPAQVRTARNGDPVPPPVGSYPSDASAFGIQEMVGTLWQYTSQFKDERQRRAVLKGGSMLWADGDWYFPGGPEEGQGYDIMGNGNGRDTGNYMPYFLMDDSFERAGTIGIRCAAESVDEAASARCYTPAPRPIAAAFV